MVNEALNRSRSVSEALLADGWRKLARTRSGSVRILSIPSFLLKEAGWDPREDLEGRWVVEGNRLVLIIRKKKVEG